MKCDVIMSGPNPWVPWNMVLLFQLLSGLEVDLGLLKQWSQQKPLRSGSAFYKKKVSSTTILSKNSHLRLQIDQDGNNQSIISHWVVSLLSVIHYDQSVLEGNVRPSVWKLRLSGKWTFRQDNSPWIGLESWNGQLWKDLNQNLEEVISAKRASKIVCLLVPQNSPYIGIFID